MQRFDAFWHEAKVMEDDEVVMVKQFAIVMELLSGGSLKAKIVEPPPPAAETAEWMRQVSSAIAQSHANPNPIPRLSLSISLTLTLTLTLIVTPTR